jgi:hypothetical protein
MTHKYNNQNQKETNIDSDYFERKRGITLDNTLNKNINNKNKCCFK